ncbi:MAG: hypothetical protein US57_C0002G0048 [Candidatus Moranbacteria bacterium GW2011_GWC2_37_73]|nr:MAG: hypothetical protein UR95_C0002G0146 [Parcubacteria group bacterium GW2011_GWC1_36_108]KKQ01011.1 MAG: hypothetical protein US09_C0003G0011 [Candidatus Moranbacteria bacterium GW2011_GWD1_36_198]KKQ02413.1 MAG: hypothetical protein US10_C0001G0011 [Candidatus Moranbacteria bacterium GW2011_GWD2_36_198]KKQ40341.1 MAG: hypothetical protein US57_C0002G0048 [Candidatus Moranbacteria bacterium GW2011_GWC2_37_73]HAS00151.1 hypothetical protein [Candidatus Moranbacteria bacterium]
MNKTEKAFRWIVNIFKKHEIPFILAGGFSAKLYGSPRKLRDIDFDIPDDKLKEIISDVKEFIVFGPEHYIDDVFDLTLLRLDYYGQKIDIGGGTFAKTYNRKKNVWIKDSTNFLRYNLIDVFGIIIPVIKPKDLIRYKSKSPREEDFIDIIAVKKFIEKQTI